MRFRQILQIYKLSLFSVIYLNDLKSLNTNDFNDYFNAIKRVYILIYSLYYNKRQMQRVYETIPQHRKKHLIGSYTSVNLTLQRINADTRRSNKIKYVLIA